MSSEDANPIEDRQTDDAVKVSADDVGFRIQPDIDEKTSGLRKAQFGGGDFETQFAPRFEL